MCNPKDLKIPKEECESLQCQWFVGNWTLCSVSCGDGIQIREVQCKAGPRKVHETHCRDLLKPDNKTECQRTACEVFQDIRFINKHDNDISNDIHYYDYDFKWDWGQWSEVFYLPRV